MNLTILIMVMIFVTVVLAIVTVFVLLTSTMEFDDVIRTTDNETIVTPNRSSRVVTTIIEGGP